MISIHERDELSTEAQLLKLEEREAEERLKLRVITSPIDGVVVRFIDKGKRRQGVRFEGTEGWVFVERGVIEAEPKSLLQERIGPDERHFTIGTDHWGGFLDCIKSRKTPVSSIESAVRTDTVCHICDIAMRLGRKLRWDPVAEQFVADAGRIAC
jgi:hypothetical protein